MADDPDNRDRPGRPNVARKRSIAIAWALIGLVALFYAATIVHLGGNAVNKPY